MTAKLFEQTYKMDDERGKEAIISFINGKFDSCQHNVIEPYTFDGWKFLKQVAGEIERLALSYEVGNGRR